MIYSPQGIDDAAALLKTMLADLDSATSIIDGHADRLDALEELEERLDKLESQTSQLESDYGDVPTERLDELEERIREYPMPDDLDDRISDLRIAVSHIAEKQEKLEEGTLPGPGFSPSSTFGALIHARATLEHTLQNLNTVIQNASEGETDEEELDKNI